MNRYSRILNGNMVANSKILSEDESSHIAAFFSAFSDPSRLRIISALTKGEMNVSSISKKVGISASAVSHQMRNLRQLRLVKSRKVGREVYYCLDDVHIIEIFNAGVKHVQHS